MARHMGTRCAISAPSFSLSWSNGAEGQFSIKGQSSLDEQSNLFIESLRPVVVSIPRNETSPADHRTTTKKYFFAARVHTEQYKNEWERVDTIRVFAWKGEKERVWRWKAWSERVYVCMRERKKVEFNNKGQSPERYIAGRRRQYFIIRTKSTTATGRISNNLLL